MKPFLYLDNYRDEQPATRVDLALARKEFPVVHLRTNDGEFPEDENFCGVYVSPSFDGAYNDEPWIHRLRELLPALARTRVPMLGLCFGSQVLAVSMFGLDQIVMRDEREKGHGTIRLTEAARTSDPLTAGLPESVPVFHWHQDEVRADHPEIDVLASSDRCRNQIWRWRDGPVWGVQPHPEFDRAMIGAWYARNPGQFAADGFGSDDMLTGSDRYVTAARIIENFLSCVESDGAPRAVQPHGDG